jgi:hypothetical protein
MAHTGSTGCGSNLDRSDWIGRSRLHDTPSVRHVYVRDPLVSINEPAVLLKVKIFTARSCYSRWRPLTPIKLWAQYVEPKINLGNSYKCKNKYKILGNL